MRFNLATLCDMLTYMRPAGSDAEEMFRVKYLYDLPGAREDAYGNLHVKVGASPILWSSHSDTVHSTSGFQTLRVNEREKTIRLSRKAKRAKVNCLGADDTVGVFLMREMILRGIPGHYVFHYGEEHGGLGSYGIRDNPAELAHVLYAIALDRKGTSDIITHQMCGRCCSEAFASSLAAQLHGYHSSDLGTFTDTAVYADVIPECTNLSVGYYHQHTAGEYVDYAHVERLLEMLCAIDANALVCARDPYAPQPRRNNLYDCIGRLADSPSDGDSSDDGDGLGYGEWCLTCDAPKSSADCGHTWDDTDDLSDEDRKFLRYLKGL